MLPRYHLKYFFDITQIVLKHMQCKEDCAEMLHEVQMALGSLVSAKTPKEFTIRWEEIQREWADQHCWLQYMENEWV
jgi:hypothetical protein